MAKQRSFRWLWITSGVIALLVVAGILGFQFAARSLKADVLQALGPESEVADLHVGFTRIIVSGVRVKAPRGWPSDSTLRAERVTILPDLRQLLSRRIYVTKVTVENGYISLVRPKEGTELFNGDGPANVTRVVRRFDDARQPFEQPCKAIRHMGPFEHSRVPEL